MKKLISPFLLFLAAFIWGIAFVFQKTASFVSTLTLLTLRSAIASLFLVFAVMLFDKLSGNQRRLFSIKNKKIDVSKRELLGGLICGVLLFIASGLQQTGISGTDVGKTAFITTLYVVLVPIFGAFIGRRSPVNSWIGVGISVIGFYLLCVKSDFTVEPFDMVVFVCAVFFALQIMTVDRFIISCDPIRLSLIQFATVSVLSFAGSLIFESPIDADLIIAALPDILFLGVFSSGVSFTLQIVGQKNTEPAVASIILCLESVIGAIASAIVLHERMLPREYAGAAIVFIAVLIAQLDFKSIGSKFKKKHTENPE